MDGAAWRVVALMGDRDVDDALLSALEAAGFDVLRVESGEEAQKRAAADPPAAVLLDLDGRSAAGYLACKLLRERCGELLPIVLLSGERIEASDRVLGLLLGANDYLVKPVDPSEVVVRLLRLVARSTARRVEVRPSEEATPVESFDLTKREQEVMGYLFAGKTQSDIAKELVISPNTVATHIQRILLKLGVHNRAQAVAKVAHAGWLLREPTANGPAPEPLQARTARGSRSDKRPRPLLGRTAGSTFSAEARAGSGRETQPQEFA